MLIGAPPPSVFFGGRLWPSDELAAMAAGWLDPIHATISPEAELTALPLANHPEAIALFFALSSLRFPVVVLPVDSRGWRTDPPLPPATPIFLPPSQASARAGDGAELRTVTLPGGRPSTGVMPSLGFLTTPGMVNFTSGSTGLPKPVYIRTRSFELQTAAIVSACRLTHGTPVAGSLPLAMHYGLGQALLLPDDSRGRSSSSSALCRGLGPSGSSSCRFRSGAWSGCGIFGWPSLGSAPSRASCAAGGSSSRCPATRGASSPATRCWESARRSICSASSPCAGRSISRAPAAVSSCWAFTRDRASRGWPCAPPAIG